MAMNHVRQACSIKRTSQLSVPMRDEEHTVYKGVRSILSKIAKHYFSRLESWEPWVIPKCGVW